jgi:hypothetical protein
MGHEQYDSGRDTRVIGERANTAHAYAHVQYVDVVFDLADTETPVKHGMKTSDSDNIRYEIVRKDCACDVYEDFSPNRRAWKPNVIYLKCNTAGARVRLKLFTERFS